MMRTLLLGLLGCIAVPCLATAQNQDVFYHGPGEFAENAQTGQLGVIWNAKNKSQARALKAVKLLDPGHLTVLSRNKAGWFVVNHRFETEPGNGDDPELRNTFMSVMLVAVFKPDFTGGPSLFVYRNANWTRSGRVWRGIPDFASFSPKGVSEAYLKKAGSEFAELHKQATVEKVDEFLNGKGFHGVPKSGSESSWDSKEFWQKDISRISGCDTPTSSCAVKAYLLSFSQTDANESAKPLLFYTNPFGVEKLYVWTFSPIHEAYLQSYAIEFTD